MECFYVKGLFHYKDNLISVGIFLAITLIKERKLLVICNLFHHEELEVKDLYLFCTSKRKKLILALIKGLLHGKFSKNKMNKKLADY
jgi:hypothetical protein